MRRVTTILFASFILICAYATVDSDAFVVSKRIQIQTELEALVNRVVKYEYDPLTARAEFRTATLYRANGDVINLDVTQACDYAAPIRTTYKGVRQIMLEIGRLEPGDIIEYEIAVDQSETSKNHDICIDTQNQLNEAGTYRKLSKSYTMRPDGSQEYHHMMELTLSKNTNSETSFIVYNPEFQTLKINHCYTVQKDGTRIDASDNAFVEVLPSWAADAPAHNQLKEMVVLHTGLELGATICLDYTITSKPGYLSELDVYTELLQSSPVQEMTLTVSVPEERTLHYTLGSLSAKPIEQGIGGQKIVTWKLRNLPASSRNPFVSVANGDVPYLAATTFASQRESLNKLYSQFTPEEDMQLESIAYTAIEGATTELEQMERIHNEVMNRYAYIDIPLEMTGYRIRTINDVFYSVYATQAEKTNLLDGLLKKIGIETETIALYRTNAYPNSLGLSAVQELAVIATVDGQQYVLSPTSRMMSPAGQLPLTPVVSVTRADNPPFLDVVPNYEIAYAVNMTVSPTQVETSTVAKVGDGHIPYFTPTTDNKPVITTQALQANNGVLTLTLADAPQGLSHTQYCRLNADRTENIALPYPVDEQYRYVLKLTDGISFSTKASNKVIENKAGKLQYSIRHTAEGVEVIRSLQLNKQLYTAKEFKVLHTLLTTWQEVSTTPLLFKVDK